MIPDDGFDYCCGKPVYNFCILASECGGNDYWSIAIGEHICLTPPVIPQTDDDMKHWAKLAKKARKKWQKENPY